MATGTIKTKTDKGFGFIKTDEAGPDVFFHSTACNGAYEELDIGQRVEFDVEQGPKGPKASNVRVASEGEGAVVPPSEEGSVGADTPDMSMAA